MPEGELEPGGRYSWSELERTARVRFGIEHFRPGQRELIDAVLAGRDALGILPTGAGKSLCYQLPSLFLKGLVVVVSPLIALMQDQQDRLERAAIEAARLDSTVKESARQEEERRLESGERDIVLVTPERLQSPEHVAPLRERGVALFVVDEAHCISQWGHDFRPAYAALRHVIEELGRPTVLALTATAPPDVAQDIQESLGMRRPRVVYGGIERHNLSLEVLRTVNEDEKRRRLEELLRTTPGSGIVYAATVRGVNELFEGLSRGPDAVARYHGKLSARERASAQERFMSGATRLMIATQAFGLGVDKPDIRFVAHWNFPESLESYYQEAGRAGRDGEAARALLFYRLEDKRIRSFFLGGKHPKASEARAVADALQRASATGTPLTLEGLATAAGISARRTSVIVAVLEGMQLVGRRRRRLVLERSFRDDELEAVLSTFEARYGADRERIETMMRYAQSTRCRMQLLREYFGAAVAEPCGHCDNCKNPVTVSASGPRDAPSRTRT